MINKNLTTENIKDIKEAYKLELQYEPKERIPKSIPVYCKGCGFLIDPKKKGHIIKSSTQGSIFTLCKDCSKIIMSKE